MIQVRNEAFWPIRIFHRYTIMIRIQYAHSQLFTPIHWFFESLFVYNPPAGSSSGWVIIRPGRHPVVPSDRILTLPQRNAGSPLFLFSAIYLPDLFLLFL